MKITKQGELKKHIPWYVGKRFSCLRCQTEVELEEGDAPAAERRPGGKQWVKCPTCGGEIIIAYPAPDWERAEPVFPQWPAGPWLPPYPPAPRYPTRDDFITWSTTDNKTTYEHPMAGYSGHGDGGK